jgi:hypothetical protein
MTTHATTPAATTTAAAPKWHLWIGRVLSALPVLMLVISASMKLSHAPKFVEMWTGKLGFQEGSLTAVGLLELACVAAYVFPRTAVLGAGLLSAYLGGAVATHVRIGDPFVIPVVLGLMVWAGLYLRDARVRALVPLRSAP